MQSKSVEFHRMEKMDSTYSEVANFLKTLHTSVGDVLREIKGESSFNSQKMQELASCSESPYLKTAYDHVEAIILYQAADHIDAIGRTLTPPILTYSPWASTRCVLEVCSLAHWLTDTEIDFKERTCRMLNVELKSTKDGLGYLRSVEKISAGTQVEDVKASIESVKASVEGLREAARKLHIPEKSDRNGRFLRFGNGLPSHANLADIAFNAGDTYRLLSGATHGEFWAHFLSTEVRDFGDAERMTLEPNFRVDSALHIAMLVTEWHAKSAWRLALLSGWNLKRLATILEEEHDKLSFTLQSKYPSKEISDNKRFWRKDYLKMILQ